MLRKICRILGPLEATLGPLNSKDRGKGHPQWNGTWDMTCSLFQEI